MADDLDDDAARLERSLQLLEEQHQAYLEQLDEPWNELRAIGGLPRESLRKRVASIDPADSHA